MAYKQFNVDSIGTISVYKRRGSKRITIRVNGSNIKVIQPYWMPYTVGHQFAIKNVKWISNQLSTSQSNPIINNTKIGKTYLLNFVSDATYLHTRLSGQTANVYLPNNVSPTDLIAQNAAKRIIKRALLKESKMFLPDRINKIAKNTGTSYAKISLKSMRSRWGSCTSGKIISLNIYLLMCSWDLIDYVILHELAHTKHLNHSKNFWGFVELYMPDYKVRRKKLKEVQASILSLQA